MSDKTQSDADKGAPVVDPTEGMTAEEQAAHWKGQAKLWQDKHNGLNGHATKLKTERDSLAQEKDSIAADAAKAALDLTTEMARIQAERDAFFSQVSTLTVERDTIVKKDEVKTLLSQNFPELGPLYEQGLLQGLETMEASARSEYLTRYAEALGGLKKQDNVKKIQGSTPPPPQQVKQTGVTIDSAKATLETAIRTKGVNSPEYMAAYQDYLAVLTN